MVRQRVNKETDVKYLVSANAMKELNIQKTKIMASGPITSWQIDGETVAAFIFLGSKSLQMAIAAMILKDAYSLEGKL